MEEKCYTEIDTVDEIYVDEPMNNEIFVVHAQQYYWDVLTWNSERNEIVELGIFPQRSEALDCAENACI